jgi:pheromone shutdown protein TraB
MQFTRCIVSHELSFFSVCNSGNGYFFRFLAGLLAFLGFFAGLGFLLAGSLFLAALGLFLGSWLLAFLGLFLGAGLLGGLLGHGLGRRDLAGLDRGDVLADLVEVLGQALIVAGPSG